MEESYGDKPAGIFHSAINYSRKKFYSTSSGGQFVKAPSWSQSVTEFARGTAMNLVTLQVAPRSLVVLALCLK